jgi:hypothetical protein
MGYQLWSPCYYYCTINEVTCQCNTYVASQDEHWWQKLRMVCGQIVVIVDFCELGLIYFYGLIWLIHVRGLWICQKKHLCINFIRCTCTHLTEKEIHVHRATCLMDISNEVWSERHILGWLSPMCEDILATQNTVCVTWIGNVLRCKFFHLQQGGGKT